MALSSLWKKGKFKALARALKSRPLAVGTLECLWACACQSADDLIGTADDVEDECDWKGKRGALVSVLTELRWIDVSPEGYRVHDFWDHAPQYAKRKRSRVESDTATAQSTASQQLATARPTASQKLSRGEGRGGEYPLPPAGARVEGTPCGAGPSRDSEENHGTVDAASFFAAVSKIGVPQDRDPVDIEERRRELDRQKRALLEERPVDQVNTQLLGTLASIGATPGSGEP